MTRILFAWELGANFGHLTQMVPIARMLRQRGHEVLFAVKDVAIAHNLLGSDGFRFLQAPACGARRRTVSKPASFADILAEAGFDDVNILKGLVASWHHLFSIVHPDLLVAQYAPSAQLAARMAGLPCISIGTGFELPPDVAPFPCFRPWLKVSNNELLMRERGLLDTINESTASLGLPASDSLQQALKANISLLATLPELDHYPGRRGGHYIGPLCMLDDGDEWIWPIEDGKPCIFAYLRPFRGVSTVMEVLKKSGANVIAVIPGISEKDRTAFSGERLKISTQRLRISTILKRAQVVVSHGGHGMMAATMLAGVPTLAIPISVEQWLSTRNVERLGSGIGVDRSNISPQFESALNRLLVESVYREQAGALARKYSQYDQDVVIERLVKTIERLPGYRDAHQSFRNC